MSQTCRSFHTYLLINFTGGIPRVYRFGSFGFHRVLIMDLLGPSLEDISRNHKRMFTLKEVVNLAKIMVCTPERPIISLWNLTYFVAPYSSSRAREALNTP